MALPTFALAAFSRAIWASSREATARPAASSAGLTILEPELRRASDLLNIDWLVCRLLAAAIALVFVLITIFLFFSRASGCGFEGAACLRISSVGLSGRSGRNHSRSGRLFRRRTG